MAEPKKEGSYEKNATRVAAAVKIAGCHLPHFAHKNNCVYSV